MFFYISLLWLWEYIYETIFPDCKNASDTSGSLLFNVFVPAIIPIISQFIP